MASIDISEHSTLLWIQKYGIKTEKGDPIDFKNHGFQIAIYCDRNPNICVLKAAQVGMSTLEIIRMLHRAHVNKVDQIYTLPTQEDVQTFVGGKVNRIIAQNPVLQQYTKDKDTIEQKQVGESMIYFRGCVDDETEVLTENGWCKRGEVKYGDKLPTLNLKTGGIDEDEVLYVSTFRVNENMVRIRNKQIDQLVTWDHRCVASKRKLNGEKGALRIIRAHELVGKTTAHIPQIFKTYEEAPDPFYSVLGWVIGDGSFWTKRDKYKDKTYEAQRVCIIQSKLCDELEGDLARAGIGYLKKTHNKTCFRYEIHAKESRRIRKILPEKKLAFDLVFKSTPSQREGLYRGLMMSDGDNYKASSFYQNKNGTCDAFQALLVFLGHTSGLTERGKKQRVSIRNREWCNPVVTEEPYNGVAWCPTTRNGTIFIRRNGKVSVTGQTWTKKAAIMVTADILIHDEIDSSKQDVVNEYQARLQHSKWKEKHIFSHPSFPGYGVDVSWQKSDQKHWFNECSHCKKEQYLSWPDSIDVVKRVFICKHCGKELTSEDRRCGRWIAKYPDKKEFSGYWVSLLICPWVTAGEIIDKYDDPNTTEEFFYNKVLGLPYVGKDSTIRRNEIMRNVNQVENEQENVVIGADSGLIKHYVVGNSQGIFYTGKTEDWGDIEKLLDRYERSIAVLDALPDLTKPREMREKYPGRVFLCHYGVDRKTMQLIRWGQDKEAGNVLVDRNRMIQLVIDETRMGRIMFNGKIEE